MTLLIEKLVRDKQTESERASPILLFLSFEPKAQPEDLYCVVLSQQQRTLQFSARRWAEPSPPALAG